MLYSRRTHARMRSDPRAGNPDSPSEGGSLQAPLERLTSPEPVEAHSSTTRRYGLLYVPGIHPRVSITLATSGPGPTALHGHPLQPLPRSPLLLLCPPHPYTLFSKRSWKQLTKHFQIPMPSYPTVCLS